MQAPAKDAQDKSEEVGKLRFIQTRRGYLTLSACLAIIGSLVGGTYQFVRLVQVEPLAQSYEEARRALAASETDRQTLRGQLTSERSKYAELLRTSLRPVPLVPPDGASVIGTHQLFVWDYVKHDANTTYVVELRRFSAEKLAETRVMGVPQSDTKRLLVTLAGGSKAEFQWRVTPGNVVNGAAIPSGPWSAVHTFSVYPTVLDRILSTAVLRLASTPTSYDRAIASDGMGGFSGYEFEVAQWLAEQLGKQLGLQSALKIDLVDVPWDRLFSAIQRGEADMAIRSITRSTARERDNPNLRFTKGYLRNHQVFIQTAAHGDFPRSLEGTVVGVKRNSINEKAAEFLSGKYRFKIDSSFIAYADIYQALRDGRIAFALVDSVLVAGQLGTEYFQFGPQLDQILKVFYQKELGTPYEEYAVLVSGAGSNDKLRKLLDGALESPQFAAFSHSLKEKYRLK